MKHGEFVVVCFDSCDHLYNSNSKESYIVLLYTALGNNQKNTVFS
jgi:hypothetical protein